MSAVARIGARPAPRGRTLGDGRPMNKVATCGPQQRTTFAAIAQRDLRAHAYGGYNDLPATPGAYGQPQTTGRAESLRLRLTSALSSGSSLYNPGPLPEIVEEIVLYNPTPKPADAAVQLGQVPPARGSRPASACPRRRLRRMTRAPLHPFPQGTWEVFSAPHITKLLRHGAWSVSLPRPRESCCPLLTPAPRPAPSSVGIRFEPVRFTLDGTHISSNVKFRAPLGVEGWLSAAGRLVPRPGGDTVEVAFTDFWVDYGAQALRKDITQGIRRAPGTLDQVITQLGRLAFFPQVRPSAGNVATRLGGILPLTTNPVPSLPAVRLPRPLPRRRPVRLQVQAYGEHHCLPQGRPAGRGGRGVLDHRWRGVREKRLGLNVWAPAGLASVAGPDAGHGAGLGHTSRHRWGHAGRRGVDDGERLGSVVDEDGSQDHEDGEGHMENLEDDPTAHGRQHGLVPLQSGRGGARQPRRQLAPLPPPRSAPPRPFPHLRPHRRP